MALLNTLTTFLRQNRDRWLKYNKLEGIEHQIYPYAVGFILIRLGVNIYHAFLSMAAHSGKGTAITVINLLYFGILWLLLPVLTSQILTNQVSTIKRLQLAPVPRRLVYLSTLVTMITNPMYLLLFLGTIAAVTPLFTIIPPIMLILSIIPALIILFFLSWSLLLFFQSSKRMRESSSLFITLLKILPFAFIFANPTFFWGDKPLFILFGWRFPLPFSDIPDFLFEPTAIFPIPLLYLAAVLFIALSVFLFSRWFEKTAKNEDKKHKTGLFLRLKKQGVPGNHFSLITYYLGILLKEAETWIGVICSYGVAFFLFTYQEEASPLIPYIFFMIPLMTLQPYIFNFFKNEGDTLKRYFFMPIRESEIIRTKQQAYFITAALQMLPLTLAAVFHYGPGGLKFLIWTVGTVVLYAVTGAFFSILSPRKEDSGPVSLLTAVFIWVFPFVLETIEFFGSAALFVTISILTTGGIAAFFILNPRFGQLLREHKERVLRNFE